MLLNFAVIAGAIVYFSKKNLPGVFRDRTALIQKSMQEACQASEEANRRLAQIEARLSRLDTEIGGMRDAAEKEIVSEESRIKAAAEEDAADCGASTEQEIAAAAKTARRELTAYAANLAVSLAAKQIEGWMQPPTRPWCVSSRNVSCPRLPMVAVRKRTGTSTWHR